MPVIWWTKLEVEEINRNENAGDRLGCEGRRDETQHKIEQRWGKQDQRLRTWGHLF